MSRLHPSGPLPLPVAVAITCRVLDANTQRSAVYTCGVMLWELLTGKSFERGSDGRPLRVSALRGDCPAAIDAILTRATCLDRTQTIATPRAMSRLLAEVIAPANDRVVEDWFAKAS